MTNFILEKPLRPIGLTIFGLLYFLGGLFTIVSLVLWGGLLDEKPIVPGQTLGLLYIVPYTSAAFGIFSILLGSLMWIGKNMPSMIYSSYMFALSIYNGIIGGTLTVEGIIDLPIQQITQSLVTAVLGVIIAWYMNKEVVKRYLGKL